MGGLTVLLILLLAAVINMDAAIILCFILVGVFVGTTPLLYMVSGALLATAYWR